MSKVRVVSFHYTLKNKNGETLDSSAGEEPLSYLENSGHIIPGLESELKKMQAGDKKLIQIAAKDAYGERRDDLIVDAQKTQFPPEATPKKGDQFRAGPNSPVFTVLDVTDTIVKLDGNHPLAGEDLSFDVEIVEIRDATDEEVAHGHVHGAHGHHHH
jgi:FKBP-type peptidyl-prolyl cis-trans isomerase SlyD